MEALSIVAIGGGIAVYLFALLLTVLLELVMAFMTVLAVTATSYMLLKVLWNVGKGVETYLKQHKRYREGSESN